MDFGKDDFALGDDAIDVEDFAGTNFSNKMIGLAVAKLIEQGPQVFGPFRVCGCRWRRLPSAA